MQIKVDAPVGALAPQKNDAAVSGKQKADGSSESVSISSEKTAEGRESSSLEPKVELRIELRILQRQQRRTSAARGEVSTAQSGLGRADAVLQRLIQYAQTARRAEDQNVRDSYEGAFSQIRQTFVQVQIDLRFPSALLDSALEGLTQDVFLSGSDGVFTSSVPLQSPEVRSDVIFGGVLESGQPDFSSTQGINQMLGRLYAASNEINTLRDAYREIGTRLDDRINSLEVEAANREASSTKPKDLDAALDLAGMTRDQMIKQAQLAQFAPGLISATRALALLEE